MYLKQCKYFVLVIKIYSTKYQADKSKELIDERQKKLPNHNKSKSLIFKKIEILCFKLICNWFILSFFVFLGFSTVIHCNNDKIKASYESYHQKQTRFWRFFEIYRFLYNEPKCKFFVLLNCKKVQQKLYQSWINQIF